MIVWDDEARRWIDQETGQPAPIEAVLEQRDSLADQYGEAFRQLVALYVVGQLTLQEWQRRFEALVIEAVGQGYAQGRGGIGLMNRRDWERVTREAREQLIYGALFVADVAQRIEARTAELVADAEAAAVDPDAVIPAWTMPDPARQERERLAAEQARREAEAAMAARAELYGGATVQAFEQGQESAHSAGKGVLVLPCYPADHGTECRSSCRCAWEIIGDEAARVWRCRWITAGDPGVCEGCSERGRLYGNLVVPYSPLAAPVE